MPVYHKLVRDHIPAIIRAKGESCRTRMLEEAEYAKELKNKLEEELREYLEADVPADALEELADMLEVIRALAVLHGSDAAELEAIRARKAEQRGGFADRVYLIDTE